jgi:hypothetical protein
MKQLVLFLMLALTGLPFAQAQPGKRQIAEQFRRHFLRLDSLALHSPSEVVLNCPREVEFMKANTGIASAASGGWAGLFHCYKSDVRAWHDWFTGHYEYKRP